VKLRARPHRFASPSCSSSTAPILSWARTRRQLRGLSLRAVVAIVKRHPLLGESSEGVTDGFVGARARSRPRRCGHHSLVLGTMIACQSGRRVERNSHIAAIPYLAASKPTWILTSSSRGRCVASELSPGREHTHVCNNGRLVINSTPSQRLRANERITWTPGFGSLSSSSLP
jgi:hypothetical protein